MGRRGGFDFGVLTILCTVMYRDRQIARKEDSTLNFTNSFYIT